MKNLLLNIVLGIVISIAVMGVATVVLGTMYVNNGIEDLMIEELFTNVGIKTLGVSVIGVAIGIVNNITKKNNAVVTIISSLALMFILFLVLNLVKYTIVFEIAYFAILGLTMCVISVAREVLVEKFKQQG